MGEVIKLSFENKEKSEEYDFEQEMLENQKRKKKLAKERAEANQKVKRSYQISK